MPCPNSFEHVSSSYIRSLQCTLHTLLTLSLTSNHVVFLPKQTHSVVESGLIKTVFGWSSNAWNFLIIDLFPLLLSFQDVFHPYRVKCEIRGMDQFGKWYSSWTKQRFIWFSSLRWICEAHTSAQHVRNQHSFVTLLQKVRRIHTLTHKHMPEQTLEHICTHTHTSTHAYTSMETFAWLQSWQIIF